MNRENVYWSGNLLMNIFMAFGIFNLFVVLVAPIFGGVLLVRGLVGYGMWILVAIVGKEYFKRLKADGGIKAYEATIGMLVVFGFFATTMHFPYGILLGALVSAGLIIGHKAKMKHFRGEGSKAA